MKNLIILTCLIFSFTLKGERPKEPLSSQKLNPLPTEVRQHQNEDKEKEAQQTGTSKKRKYPGRPLFPVK